MLETILFLSALLHGFVDVVKDAILQKWPNANLWWLLFVALAGGVAVTALGHINALATYLPGLAGEVATGLVIGTGSRLINVLFKIPAALRGTSLEIIGIENETVGTQNIATDKVS